MQQPEDSYLDEEMQPPPSSSSSATASPALSVSDFNDDEEEGEEDEDKDVDEAEEEEEEEAGDKDDAATATLGEEGEEKKPEICIPTEVSPRDKKASVRMHQPLMAATFLLSAKAAAERRLKDEDVLSGRVKAKAYNYYLKAIGYWASIAILLLFIFNQVVIIYVSVRWSFT